MQHASVWKNHAASEKRLRYFDVRIGYLSQNERLHRRFASFTFQHTDSIHLLHAGPPRQGGQALFGARFPEDRQLKKHEAHHDATQQSSRWSEQVHTGCTGRLAQANKTNRYFSNLNQEDKSASKYTSTHANAYVV